MILHGDCLDVLKTFPENSVHTCVTSPPYWSLRDYGVPPSGWGGDPACEHDFCGRGRGRGRGRDSGSGLSGPPRRYDFPDWEMGSSCECGAWRGALGLEPTPDLFVAHLVEVFREVRRVLRKDGTAWVNMGDSYQNAKGQAHGVDPKQPARRHLRTARPNDKSIEGLKAKDLVGVPWMLAFALRADGWYLRSDIIWSKPNPMPESTQDRPTKAHEYVFLLAKSKRYYYNADAIREPYAESTQREIEDGYDGHAVKEYAGTGAQNPSETKQRIIESVKRRSAHMTGTPRNDGDRWRTVDGGVAPRGSGRNKRTVWTIPTQPTQEAHFATFPEDLVEPCIRAGCPEDGTVLDPFAGSGTVAVVCEKLQRKFIGIELNPSYIQIAERRIAAVAPLFAEPVAVGRQP